MPNRSIDKILAEWRALERRLEADGREDVAGELAELAALREEYARAVDARQGQAADLRSFTGYPGGSAT